MDNIPVKVDGTTSLSASEFNSFYNGSKNLVLRSGQTLDIGNTNQVNEAVAKYASGGGFWYDDIGAADNYILLAITPTTGFFHPKEYFEGMQVGCAANASSTGSTASAII